jgi:hypothetical protein
MDAVEPAGITGDMAGELIGGSDDSGTAVPRYEIRLRGRLDESWSGWLGGLDLRVTPAGETIASGPIQDQAALHGLLERIRDMGIELLTLRRVDWPGA